MINLPKTIKMVITDFDGVITDNCVYIDQNENVTRKLNFKDIMAMSLLKKNNIKIGIICEVLKTIPSYFCKFFFNLET